MEKLSLLSFWKRDKTVEFKVVFLKISLILQLIQLIFPNIFPYKKSDPFQKYYLFVLPATGFIYIYSHLNCLRNLKKLFYLNTKLLIFAFDEHTLIQAKTHLKYNPSQKEIKVDIKKSPKIITNFTIFST